MVRIIKQIETVNCTWALSRRCERVARRGRHLLIEHTHPTNTPSAESPACQAHEHACRLADDPLRVEDFLGRVPCVRPRTRSPFTAPARYFSDIRAHQFNARAWFSEKHPKEPLCVRGRTAASVHTQCESRGRRFQRIWKSVVAGFVYRRCLDLVVRRQHIPIHRFDSQQLPGLAIEGLEHFG